MAAHGDTSEHSGGMDITDHKKTWLGFIRGVRWSLIGILAIMVVLAIFRTH